MTLFECIDLNSPADYAERARMDYDGAGLFHVSFECSGMPLSVNVREQRLIARHGQVVRHHFLCP